MDGRFNTIAGWVLGAGIVLLGATLVTGEFFKAERPETMGYPIPGVQEEGAEGGAAAEPPIAHYLQTADAARGEAVFRRCQSCHNVDNGGANGLGPNLWGTAGNTVAHRPDFSYSDALKNHGGRWDWDTLVGLAAFAEPLRAGNEDDLRRPFRPAGPRRHTALSQPAWRHPDHPAAAARGRRSGRRQCRRWQRGGGQCAAGGNAAAANTAAPAAANATGH